jgi:hypothetical protein
MTEEKKGRLSIYYQAAIAMMLIQLVHKIVREIPGGLETVGTKAGVMGSVFSAILLIGIVLLFFRIRWGLILGIVVGVFMLIQPVVVHIIWALPDWNGIWWYPIFPWVQAILMIYFCLLAWKRV